MRLICLMLLGLLISLSKTHEESCTSHKGRGLLKGKTTKSKIFGKKVKKGSLKRFLRLVDILKKNHEEFNKKNEKETGVSRHGGRQYKNRLNTRDSDSKEYAYRYRHDKNNRRMKRRFEKFEKRESEGESYDCYSGEDDTYLEDQPRIHHYKKKREGRDNVVVYRTKDIDWNRWMKKVSMDFDKIEEGFSDFTFSDEDEEIERLSRNQRYGNDDQFKFFKNDTFDFDDSFQKKSKQRFNWSF